MIQLKSITLDNFRSIRGSIMVPLDAPVVLIHGHNGAGKTSLLAGIELALTGDVASLSRVDPHYQQHLLHKEATQGKVTIEVNGLSDSRTTSDFVVHKDNFRGSPILTANEARFYDERCFLAQATLGRLLEIYEDKDARQTDSPLTKFVKDLLGLDQLDALIEGLHDAGDVRRFRSTVPAYWETRENIPALQKELDRQESIRKSLANDETVLISRTADKLSQIGLPTSLLSDLPALAKVSDGSYDDAELKQLAIQRRECEVLRAQWTSSVSGASSLSRESAEARAAEAASKFNAWKDSDGRALEELVEVARHFFANIPSPAEVGNQESLDSAFLRTEAELTRCSAALAQAHTDDQKRILLDQQVKNARARTAVLDTQIAQHVADSSTAAQALNSLLPHIHTDNCPVCGRNFKEVSAQPLHAHVLARVAELSESSGRLEALLRERAVTLTAQAKAERDRANLESSLLESKARDVLKTREADLKELREALVALRPVAKVGGDLSTVALAASRELAELESKDLRLRAVRETIDRLEREFSLDLIGPTDSPIAALDRLNTTVSDRTTFLLARQATRREATDCTRELSALQARRTIIQSAIDELRTRIDRLKTAQAAADGVIHNARELAKRARGVRTEIVRRVFNDKLNIVWKDLFVRLAPEELFVPAFALPEESGGPVEAALETQYKSAGKGGNPRAMLSAGNLNTAALTLFLALHLSVSPSLPWLVIDDPIQSMDEVHIAQFAALLRTLSKAHNRQVIIAVHEKPLFDYLSLELSPAFPTDRLITIELSRSANGETLMKYEPRVWRPDTAIAA